MALIYLERELRPTVDGLIFGVGGEAGTDITITPEDDLLIDITSPQDVRIVGINLNYPIGSVVDVFLVTGRSVLVLPALSPKGAVIRIADPAAAAAVDNCVVGAGRVLRKAGEGALAIFIHGGIAGRKRIYAEFETARKGVR